jgi:hypothetical protein
MDEYAMKAALNAWNNNFLPACYPTMQDAYDASLRIAIRAYLAAIPASPKGAYTQEMTDAYTEAQFRGVSAETQAQLDAIDDNIRAAHRMASTTFVGGCTSSAQVAEHQPTPTENKTRA